MALCICGVTEAIQCFSVIQTIKGGHS